MNCFNRPLGAKACTAFTVLCIAALLTAIAFCQEHYLGDLPQPSVDSRHARHDDSSPRTESAFYGPQTPGPFAPDEPEEGVPESLQAAKRHCSQRDARPAQSLFARLINLFLR